MNPQLYKWLATINNKSSTGNIISQDNNVVYYKFAELCGQKRKKSLRNYAMKKRTTNRQQEQAKTDPKKDMSRAVRKSS